MWIGSLYKNGPIQHICMSGVIHLLILNQITQRLILDITLLELTNILHKRVLCVLTTYFYCLFLSVVWRNFCFRGWKKSHQQSITRKRMFACSIHFCGGILLWVEMREWECSLWKSHWRECVGPVSENVKRERVLEDERIYSKFLSWSRFQKRGMKLKWQM